MADIQAFHGLRYDLAQIGSIQSVVAPPCDCITPELQEQLYGLSPYNVVRLILNRADAETASTNRSEQRPGVPGCEAAWLLKRWRRDQILKPEHQASVYVYHQTFESHGVEFTRRGFMSRVSVRGLSQGSPAVQTTRDAKPLGPAFSAAGIFPHERTYDRPLRERLALIEACDCNLSPILTVYDDPTLTIQNALEDAIEDRTPLTVNQVEPDGRTVRHQLWAVNSSVAISQVAQLLGPKPLWIADGHHRYAAAVELQSRREAAAVAAGGQWDPNDPANYTLAMLVSADDPGLKIFPTHRLYDLPSQLTTDSLIGALGPYFACRIVPGNAQNAWELLQLESDPTTLALSLGETEAWVLASLTSAGEQRMRQVSGVSDLQLSLSAAILHELALTLIGIPADSIPKFINRTEDVEIAISNNAQRLNAQRLNAQRLNAQRLNAQQLACLLLPPSVGDVAQATASGQLMPPKSTYFWPKLLSGLVFNPLS